MGFSRFATGSVAALLATASATSMTVRETAGIVLKPAVYPNIDPSDVLNLHVKQGATLHYDSNTDSNVDSTIATISAPSSAYPMVQIENSKYIKSIFCTTSTAQITFSDYKAFSVAKEDWQSYGQFILVSHDPNCGSGHAAGKRDFALVRSMTTDSSAMAVNATIDFIDYKTAIGKDVLVTSSFGPSSALHAGSVKRTSESETISWNEYPTNALTDSQWGPGFQIYSGSELDVICVHCGTEGSMTLTGTVNWTVSDGITAADVAMNGAMSVVMEVGVDAKSISESIPIGSVSLAQIPLDSIDVPDIMTLGPQLDISASASASISATGSMLAGATLNWPGVAADLVLEGSGASGGSGWTPTFSPVSSIQGSVSATLNLNLPIQFAVGVNLLNGEYQKSIGVTDTPGLELNAQAGTSSPCVDLTAGLSNDVEADILGLTTIPITTFTTPIYSTCIGGGPTAPPTTTPTPAHAAGADSVEKVRNGRRYRQAA